MNNIEYKDRFGHTWSIRPARSRGKSSDLTFICGEIELIATAEEVKNTSDLSETEVKELFCDAERMIIHQNEKWFVGYRTRVGGRGGRAQAGICTRFRSESGEVRYSKSMLHFRHMSAGDLSKHLAKAQAGVS